ncbi:MAG TPA: hypothetical protein VFZ93_00410, partial [Albitalea sp.]
MVVRAAAAPGILQRVVQPSRRPHPMNRPFRFLGYAVAATVIATAASCMSARDWRTASREPVGLAPDP